MAAARPAAPRIEPFPDHLVGVGDARQVLAVVAGAYGDSTATVTGWQRTASGWREAFGPWSAHVGRDGFAPPGDKREGDLRTPSGSFGFGFAFGVLPDPGTRLAFRRVTGPDIVWDDDPSSARYNEWVDTSQQYAGRSPEPMDRTPQYGYGVVIGYNTARTPGAGSAIFFHVTDGLATTGCVAVAQSQVLTVLGWLDPAAAPRVVLGVAGVVTR